MNWRTVLYWWIPLNMLHTVWLCRRKKGLIILYLSLWFLLWWEVITLLQVYIKTPFLFSEVPIFRWRETWRLWRMPSSGMWRRVDIVWTDVSEERIASIFRVEKSASEEPTWAGDCRLWTDVSEERRFTQDLHGATSQKTALFMDTAVKTSNLTWRLRLKIVKVLWIFSSGGFGLWRGRKRQVTILCFLVNI
jgi:hypothetical protein